MGVGVGPSGVGGEGGRPFGFVAFDQLVDPVAGQAVVAGHFAFAAAFDDDGGDDELGLGHGLTPETSRCQLCPGTAAMSLNSDTAGGTGLHRVCWIEGRARVGSAIIPVAHVPRTAASIAAAVSLEERLAMVDRRHQV